MTPLRAKLCQLRTFLGVTLCLCSASCGNQEISDRPAPADAAAGDADASASDADASATRDAGAAPDPTAHSVASQCQAQCVEAEPEPSVSPDCSNGTQANCVRACRKALEDTDAPCARCLLEGVRWEPASGGCSSWECVCYGGYAEFPRVTSAACDEACSATRARRARDRLSSSVPESWGRAPDGLVEHETLRTLSFVSVGSDDVVWVGGDVHSDEGSSALVARIDADLALQRRHGLADSYGVAGLLADPREGGAIVATHHSSKPGTLMWLNVAGDLQFERVLDVPDEIDALFEPAWTPNGHVIGRVGERGAALFDSAGARLWRRPLGESSDGSDRIRTVGIQASGRVLWGGTDGDRGVVVQLRNEGEPNAPRWVERWRHHYVGDGERQRGRVDGLLIDDAGRITVHGVLRKKEANRGAYRIYSPPFVARLSTDGEPLWQWEPEPLFSGRIHALAVDDAGHVYTVGTEDPTAYAPEPPEGEVACTVYGCDGLAVRKLSPEGELLWEYQHRQARSFGHDIALDSQGRVYVVGRAKRERRVGLVMRFDPP